MELRSTATHSRNVDSRTPVIPRTSAQREACSRVPCRYFNSQTGCHRGKECWFLHDIASHDTSSTSSNDMTDMSSPQATSPDSSATADAGNSASLTCGICLEPPAKFGLMVNCSHVFCLICIRKWRDSQGKTEDTVMEGMHKTCPTCRTHSKYVIPSNVFYAHSTPEKQAEIDQYLSNTAKIPCRHFSSSPRSRSCPFGNECHYAHNVNGTRYVFSPAELARQRQLRERRAMQQQTEAMLEGFMNQDAMWGTEENEAFVWDILHGLMEHEHIHHIEDELFGRRGQWWSDDEDDDEDYEVEEDDEDEEDDDYDEDEDSDEMPDLIDDDDDDDNMPDLMDDEDEIPDLVDDIPDDLPPLVDDDLPPLVDDDHTTLADDELPPLVDDIPDDLPELVEISRAPGSVPNPRTREDWGPTNAQNDESNRQPQISINGHTLTSTRPTLQSTNATPPANNPRPVSNPGRRTNNQPSVSLPHVEGIHAISHGVAPLPAPPAQLPPPQPSARNPVGTIPSSRLRRFTPPQHTPPPGPRRPRPPRSRARDTSRPRYVPRNAPRPAPPPPDEYGWDDDDGTNTTDGEVSERERQRTRDSEERGINARNWDSRASDLSYFRSL